MFNSMILSCEHAGNDMPLNLRYLFDGEPAVLETHRGWDLGAFALAKFLSSALNVPLLSYQTTRLLIETNRSADSTELFSSFSSVLPDSEKEKLLREHYLPYRNNLQQLIKDAVKPVLHLSIHSFTSIWNGTERSVDIGILFDAARNSEAMYSHRLKKELEKSLPNLVIKYNEPYKGTDDGITTWLRGFYQDSSYTGIELEVNQKYASNLIAIQNELVKAIQSTLR